MCVSGGKKWSFLKKIGVFCFLETPVLRFALWPYCQRYYLQIGQKGPKVAYSVSRVLERSKKYLIGLWSDEFVSDTNFSKYCGFDYRGDVINPKLGQKGPKLVLHVPMMIERWKSIVKRNLKWSIRFWNHYFKILKFRLPVVMSSTQKWVKNVQIGISYTPMLIERWKLKVKGTLSWIIRSWNRSLKSFGSTWWCHQPKLARNLILHHFQKICKFGHFLIQF